ncbi:MAG: hypothetical protein R3309_09610 [Reinekea sp.]|nr:hypothetical protein [Reinekea sp.]
MRNVVTLLSATLLLCVGSAFAVDLDRLPLSEIQQQAVTNSLTLKTDDWTLSQRADALQSDLLDRASISTSALTQKNLQQDLPATTVVTVKGDVALTSTLSLSAQIDSNQQSSVSFSFSPFADDLVSASDREQLQQAKLTLAYDQLTLVNNVEQAVLAVIKAEQTLNLTEQDATLTAAQEQSKRSLLQQGMASASDVAEATQQRVSAQQAVYAAQLSLLDSQQALQVLVGTDVVVPDINVETLTKLISQRSQQLATLSVETIQSKNIEQLLLQQQTLTSDMADIHVYNPDVRFTGEYDIDDNAVKLGVSLSFSRSQFGADALTDLDQELALKTMELAQQRNQLQQQYQLLTQKLALSEGALAARQLEAALAVQDWQEMVLLQQQGDRTLLQVDQQNYLKHQADQRVFEALMEVYLAQNNLAMLWR